MTPASNSIPIIDISPYISPTSTVLEQGKIVEAIRDACIQYGFFQLIGHGIPLEDQQKVLDCAKMFFDLPIEQKVALSMKNAMGECGRGYEVIGGQVLEEGKMPDVKEVCGFLLIDGFSLWGLVLDVQINRWKNRCSPYLF